MIAVIRDNASIPRERVLSSVLTMPSDFRILGSAAKIPATPTIAIDVIPSVLSSRPKPATRSTSIAKRTAIGAIRRPNHAFGEELFVFSVSLICFPSFV